jgi:hypothetical protein
MSAPDHHAATPEIPSVVCSGITISPAASAKRFDR